jgi:hypothetical protein
MCRPRVGAHHEAMFNDYETTRALVNDRQRTLGREAAQHRLARSGRQARRRNVDVRSNRAGVVEPLLPPTTTAHTNAPRRLAA